MSEIKHTCHAIGCPVEIPPKLLFCLKHWRLVPAALQREVWRYYRKGQEITKDPSPEYLEVMDRAIESVRSRGAEEG